MTRTTRHVSTALCLGLLVLLLTLGGFAATDSAKADPYRWCAQYGTSSDNGTNCYFLTLDQCRAAISGNGGFCTPNPFYSGTPAQTGNDASRRRR